MLTPRVLLRLGSTTAEVEALSPERRGALRVLAREVEEGLGLYPQSYGLFGPSGKVDSVLSLRRALEEAGAGAGAGDHPGTCELEVRERPEWKWAKLREVDGQIQMLSAKGAAIDAAMKEQEERIMARVEASLSKVREELIRTDAKVCQSVAPMVHCLSEDQIDLKSQIAEVQEALARTDAKVCQGLAPLMQCLAEEQLDRNAMLDGLDPKVHQLEMEQVDTKTQLDCMKTKLDVEAAFSRLAEITAECVTSLGDRATATAESPRMTAGETQILHVKSAFELDCMSPPSTEGTTQADCSRRVPDAFTHIAFGSKATDVFGKSKDLTLKGSWSRPGSLPTTTPFACRGLQLSRSTPQLLPPLQ
jgi:hypothetical protein